MLLPGISTITQGLMPTKDELGEYESMECVKHHQNLLFFNWDSSILIVKYNRESYEERKNNLLEKYTYMMAKEGSVSRENMPLYFFSDSFLFKVHSDIYADDGYEYPKRVVLVGTSDDTAEIAYIYFRDEYLDTIGDFNNFLLDCAWPR